MLMSVPRFFVRSRNVRLGKLFQIFPELHLSSSLSLSLVPLTRGLFSIDASRLRENGEFLFFLFLWFLRQRTRFCVEMERK